MKIRVEFEPGENQATQGENGEGGRLGFDEEGLFCRWAEAVYRERVRQVAKWGDQRHADDTGGETMRAHAEGVGDPGWRLIMSEEVAEAFAESGVTDPGALCGELVHVAAVDAAWWSDVKRRVE